MATNFQVGDCEIWGIQYHPEITYKKMVDIIKFRKETLIKKRNRFKDEKEINSQSFTLKNMKSGEQSECSIQQLLEVFK